MPSINGTKHEAYRVKAELAAAKVPMLLGPLTTTAPVGMEGTETVLNLAGTLHESGVPIALTGGHLLDCKAGRLGVQLQDIDDLRLAMPETRRFLQADLTGDPTAALDKAERAGKQ